MDGGARDQLLGGQFALGLGGRSCGGRRRGWRVILDFNRRDGIRGDLDGSLADLKPHHGAIDYMAVGVDAEAIR
jgi:hypothetical protein